MNRSKFMVGLALAAGLMGFSLAVGYQADDTAASETPEPMVVGDRAAHPGLAQLESYRADLLAVATIYFELGALLQNDNIQSATAEAIAKIERLTYEDLAMLSPASVDLNILRSSAQRLRDQIFIAMSRGVAQTGRTVAASPGFPDAPYSALCGSVRTDTAILFAARLTFQIAQGVWSVASRGCDLVVAGFNLTLVCIPIDLILFAAELVLDELENCDGDIDSAEIEGTYDRVGHLHGDLEIVQVSIDLLDGKVDVIDGKVDSLNGAVSDVTAAVEELRQLNCEIVRLLHTPQGRRTSDIPVCSDQPGFPYDWPP